MTKLNLGELRKKIDKTDRKLIEILAERFDLTKKVGKYKKEHNLETFAEKREKQVFKDRKKWGEESDLEPALIKQIFTLIIEEVKVNHQKIKKGG